MASLLGARDRGGLLLSHNGVKEIKSSQVDQVNQVFSIGTPKSSKWSSTSWFSETQSETKTISEAPLIRVRCSGA